MTRVVVLVRKVDVEIDDGEGSLLSVGPARRTLEQGERKGPENARPEDSQNHAGSLPGFHLMLQPMLGF